MEKKWLEQKLVAARDEILSFLQKLNTLNELNLTAYQKVVRDLEEVDTQLWNHLFDREGTFQITIRAEIHETVCSPSADGSDQTRQEALRRLRQFSNGAANLTVVDPYLFGDRTLDPNGYVDELIRATGVGSPELKRLHVVFDSSRGNNKYLRRQLTEKAISAGTTFSEKDTNLFHDRIWLADRQRAVLVGTSFGGLGNRLCFIVDLPELDVKVLLQFLEDNGLCPPSC